MFSMRIFKSTVILVVLFSGFMQKTFGQHSKYLEFLVDSLPHGKPVFVNLPVPKGFMALERIAISKRGKTLFYGVRNGYDSMPKAHILKIDYKNDVWTKPKTVFADSAGAPSFSRNGKIIYFQYDHPFYPKGMYSKKTTSGWSKPIRFIKSLKKSHYLQSPSKSSYYYSAGIKGDDKIQDIFHVTTTRSDTIINRLNFNIKGDFVDLYVAKDESFMLLLINKKNNNDAYTFYAKTDIFISFKTKNKGWSLPINLGQDVNGSVSPWNWGPYVTDDKKYLIFSSWPKKVGTYMINFEPLLKKAKAKLN
ncbi:hypothetical protein MHTCC0001_25330 [Flavobacteriaceae bacterium MHTCC 0001]